MCTPTELIASLLFIGLLLCMGFGFRHELKFTSHVERNHPTEWRNLAKRGKHLYPEDGNTSYAGAQWYLILRGEYTAIDDPELKILGFKARRAAFLGLGFLVGLALFVVFTQATPSFRCLVP
jgi:hypothetical protein